jgi:nicotinic acid mononucleotide adenylyltransferase
MPKSTSSDPLAGLLAGLAKDDMRVFAQFEEIGRRGDLTASQIEALHEFMEAATNRIRNSKSKLDREAAAYSVIEFLKEHNRRMGIHPRFLATIGSALVTYFQNHKKWDPAIAACELLVSRNVTDEDGEGFHARLDHLYQLRLKKSQSASDVDSEAD